MWSAHPSLPRINSPSWMHFYSKESRGQASSPAWTSCWRLTCHCVPNGWEIGNAGEQLSLKTSPRRRPQPARWRSEARDPAPRVRGELTRLSGVRRRDKLTSDPPTLDMTGIGWSSAKLPTAVKYLGQRKDEPLTMASPQITPDQSKFLL